jgi:hypothetical protein
MALNDRSAGLGLVEITYCRESDIFDAGPGGEVMLGKEPAPDDSHPKG